LFPAQQSLPTAGMYMVYCRDLGRGAIGRWKLREGVEPVSPGAVSGPVQALRFLVTAKTQPIPSTKYRETVCTAGITEGGEWVRLYPVPFRYWEGPQQFGLYDWVEVPARKRPPGSDKRKENWAPAGELRVLEQVGTQDKWAERKRLLLPRVAPSLEWLHEEYERDGTSLGIIRPAEVLDVVVEADDSDWTPRQQAALEQMALDGSKPKALEKPGHWFSYRFRCDGANCRGHCLQILDWGLYELYRTTKHRRDEGAAVEGTREKCWELVASDKDPYFFVGKHSRYPGFMVIGMFYPPRDERIPLPLD